MFLCVGGIWGALATGLFATKLINSAGNNGLFYGNPHQLLVQLYAIGATLVYSAVGTLVICKMVDAVFGIRVSEEEEAIGLDLSQHREGAYTVLE